MPRWQKQVQALPCHCDVCHQETGKCNCSFLDTWAPADWSIGRNSSIWEAYFTLDQGQLTVLSKLCLHHYGLLESASSSRYCCLCQSDTVCQDDDKWFLLGEEASELSSLCDQVLGVGSLKLIDNYWLCKPCKEQHFDHGEIELCKDLISSNPVTQVMAQAVRFARLKLETEGHVMFGDVLSCMSLCMTSRYVGLNQILEKLPRSRGTSISTLILINFILTPRLRNWGCCITTNSFSQRKELWYYTKNCVKYS